MWYWELGQKRLASGQLTADQEKQKTIHKNRLGFFVFFKIKPLTKFAIKKENRFSLVLNQKYILVPENNRLLELVHHITVLLRNISKEMKKVITFSNSSGNRPCFPFFKGSLSPEVIKVISVGHNRQNRYVLLLCVSIYIGYCLGVYLEELAYCIILVNCVP